MKSGNGRIGSSYSKLPPISKKKKSRIKKKRKIKTSELKTGENALLNWERQQKDWKEIENRISKKIKQNKSSLIMNRSQNDYRKKIEEIDIIESSIPSFVRCTPKTWELNLRNDSEETNETVMVKLKNDFPYPLYCPVKLHPSKKKLETIRKTIKTSNPKRRKSETITSKKKLRKLKKRPKTREKQILGIRNLESNYVKKKYKKYIDKNMEYDPVDEMNDLIVIGKRKEITEIDVDDLETHFFTNAEEKELYISQMMLKSQIIKQQGELRAVQSLSDKMEEESYTEESIESDEISEDITRENYLLEVPKIQLSVKNLSFQSTKNQLVKRKLVVKNVSLVALFYDWKRLAPEESEVLQFLTKKGNGLFQVSRDVQIDQKESNAKVILPGEEITFTFLFQSGKEGVFIDEYEFSTVPKTVEQNIISLRGVTYSPHLRDHPKHPNQEKIEPNQQINDLEAVVNEYKKKRKVKKDNERIEIDKKALFLEENGFAICSDQSFQIFNQFITKILDRIGNKFVWDYSICSARSYIQQINEETKKYQFLKTLNSMEQKLLNKEELNHEKFEILKSSVSTIVEDVVTTGEFLDQMIFNPSLAMIEGEKMSPKKRKKLDEFEYSFLKRKPNSGNSYDFEINTQSGSIVSNSLINNVQIIKT